MAFSDAKAILSEFQEIRGFLEISYTKFNLEMLTLRL